jgi:hypothetical protein
MADNRTSVRFGLSLTTTGAADIVSALAIGA